MNTLSKNFILAPFNLLYRFSPKVELKLIFRIKQGYSLNLREPRTYNEKLQWIKLFDHNALMPKCCDKYTVRDFVKTQGCENILNHLIWQGFNPEEIPFDELPDKFVIKVTHGSTFNIICKDKNMLDREKVVKKCKKWLNAKFLPCYGEWFYGIVKPRVIVEDFIESDSGNDLLDYKVFCFNGEPRYIRIDSDRFTNHKSDFYDIEWKYMVGKHTGYPCAGNKFDKPDCLDELLDYSRKLSEPFLHARVDYYIVKNKITFGEITFTNGAGFDKFSSYEFDLEMGKWLKLEPRKIKLL